MTTTEPMSAVKLALLAKEVRARLEGDGLLAGEPIAIIGMGCRFPGGVESPDDLWELVRSGGDAIVPVPPDRWAIDEGGYGDVAGMRAGGFVQDIGRFDAAFFGISPREAMHMDPQQRLVLEVAADALERAGQPADRLAGSLTGVFIAATHHDYGDRYVGHLDEIGAHTLTGNVHCIIPNRLSFLLDLRGPSVAIDTACSSSLVALHLACQSLRSRDSDMALAGGVNVVLTPDAGVALEKWGVMAPDGHCKTFDRRADGFVRGEGCGVVVLKRLADAIADNDPVVAVVRGTACNQDGRSTAMSAPNGPAQEDVVRRALRDGAVDPSMVGCVEAHGTGTIIGDPIEVEALASVLGPPVEGAPPVALTAVKANIGHLEAAAGVAGLIKAVMCLHHGEVPAAAQFTELNPHISLGGTRLFVPTEPHPWPRSDRPRVAGVSSFGFGGTNSHVVVEEAPLLPVPAGPEGSQLLVLSAQQPHALAERATAVADLLAGGADLSAVCATAARRRTHHDERLAVVGDDPEVVAEALRAVAAGERRANAVRGRRRSGRRRRVAFVYSGQGTQWWAMARELLAVDEVFRAEMERCDAALAVTTGWSVLDALAASEAESRLDETEVAQPAIFAVQVALTARWKAWGVTPDAVVGHSVGEIAAAHVAGALTLEQAAHVLAHRARLMQAATGHGTMASVALPASELVELVERSEGALSIAARNAPAVTVLAGDTEAMAGAVDELRARGAEVRPLGVDYAFHSRQMAPHAAALREALTGLEPSPTSVPMVSTVTGTEVAGTALDAGYWERNVAEPVGFTDAVAALAAEGVDVFLEVGSHPVLGGAVLESVRDQLDDAVVAASLRKGRPDLDSLLLGLGQLHVCGVGVDWAAVHPGRHRVAELPTYPWQRERHWYDVSTAPVRREVRPTGDFGGRRVRSAAIEGTVFELELGPDQPALLSDHRIGDLVVVPATAHLAMAAAAFGEVTGRAATTLGDIEVLEALAVPGPQRTVVQVHLLGDAARSTFTVSSLRPDDTWAVHARGTLSATPVPAPGVVDLDGLRTELGSPTSGAAVYAEVGAAGVRFGPSFRLLDEVWTGSDDALGALSAPVAATAPFDPASLDAAMHPIATLVSGSDDVHLPVAVAEVRLHGPLVGRLWSHVHLVEAGPQALTLDVAVISDDGEVRAEMIGLRVVRTSVDAVARIAGAATSGAPSLVHRLRWDPAPLVPSTASTAPCLVVADRGGVATALVRHAAAAGLPVALVDADEPLDPVVLEEAMVAGRVGQVLYLRGLDTPPLDPAGDPVADQQRAVTGALAVARAVGAAGVGRLWLVTRGAQAVDGTVVAPEQATLVGLAAAARVELDAVECIVADLDPADDDDRCAAAIVEMVGGPDGEELVAWRSGVRHAARLVAATDGPGPAPSPTRLAVGAPGVLDSLHTVPFERRAPGPGEVEVEVRVTGLNFREVLIVLDLYPERVELLGDECSGVVTRVGPGVSHLVPGQRVVGLGAGAFASHVTVAADLVAVLPDTIDFEAAASIPLAFLTAHDCLVTLADLRAGERVLVHAGAGGVGMAAIQLAQRLGAEVYATAGTPAKRALLGELGVEHTFDSRSLDFADGVRDATGGAGVDVVLNSLAGDFIPRSLELLAPGGRFVEIGRRDIWDAEAVADLRPDVRYDVMFLGDRRTHDPAGLGAELRELLGRFGTGELTPLPVTPFAWADAPQAFRFMAQARHTGKIVVRQPTGSGPGISADGTYVVTGGLGGIGLQVARHLAERGAGRIALLGRRPPGADAAAVVEAIRQLGTEVVVLSADVADADQLRGALDALRAAGPPVRGIVHAAGVVADSVLEHQTWERVAEVLAPKLTGAALLAHLTTDDPVEVMVLCSSAATAMGAPGQAGYAAANAFLDAFASSRPVAARRTLSVGWGVWDGVGMTAAIGDRDLARMARRGALPMAPAAALAALDAVLADAELPPAVVVARIEPDASGDRPLLSELVPRRGREPVGAVAGATAVTPVALIDTWAALPEGLRRGAIQTFLLQEATKVLGLPSSTPVDTRQPFQELGLDSLMAVELRNAIGVALGRPQPATLIFDHPTLDSLADRMLDDLGELADPGPLPDSPVESAPPRADGDAVDLESVAAMSEEEAEALLLQELEHGGGRL